MSTNSFDNKDGSSSSSKTTTFGGAAATSIVPQQQQVNGSVSDTIATTTITLPPQNGSGGRSPATSSPTLSSQPTAASTTATTSTPSTTTATSNILSSSSTTTVHRDILLPVVLWCGPPTHWITAILITPDKRTIVTGSQAGHIVISSVYLDSLKESQFMPKIFTLGHNGSPVTCLAMCQVEGHEAVVSTAADGSLAVWNISDGFCLVASPPNLLMCSPSFMVTLPNKRRVAIVGKGSNSIYIVDVQTLSIIATLSEHTDWITCLFTCTISQNASPLLLSASLDGTIRFWSLNEGEFDFSLQTICLSPEGNCSHLDAPLAIEFSPNGKLLLVVSKNNWSVFSTNNSYKLWSIKCPHPQGWYGGSFVNNSMSLVWTRDGRSFLYKLDQVQGEQLKSFSMGHPMPMPGTSPINLIPKINITDSTPGASVGQICDSIEVTYLAPETPPPQLILSFANYDTTSKHPLSHSQQTSGAGGLSSSMSSSSMQHQSLGQQHVQQHAGCDITNKIGAAMCWSNVFLVGDSYGRVKIWVIPVDDMPPQSMRKLVREPNLIGHISSGWSGCETKTRSKVTASLVLEDMLLLVRGYEDGSISTSKLPTDLLTKFHPGSHTSRVNCLMSSQPVGNNTRRRLFSASSDTTIKVWELSTFTLLHTFSHHTGPVTSIFSLPQMKKPTFVSISDDKTLGMYSSEDLVCKHMFGVHSSSVARVFWKPEQGYLIVETVDGSVALWEIGSGELEGVVYGQVAKDIIDNALLLSISPNPKDTILNNFTQTTQSLIFTNKNDPPIQTIFLNVKAISDEIIKYTEMAATYSASLNTNPTAISSIHKVLEHLISIFSYLIPWGMDRNLDPMFKKDFKLRPPQPDFSLGLMGEGGNISFLTPQASSTNGKMQCSEYLTAQITLSAVALARSILRIGGMENVCSQLTTYYCITLPDSLPTYVFPDFSYLASYCQDNSDDIMFSARSIFKSSIEMMPTPQFQKLLDYYSQLLRSDSLGHVERARAVIVLGKIASHRKDLVPPEFSLKIGQELLKMIFKGKGHLTTAAVELIGKGFLLWKESIRDHVPNLIKCLFTLTTQNDILSTTATNSLLLIGSIDTVRFIQTVGDEITHEAGGVSTTIHAIMLIGLLIKNNSDAVLPFLPRVIDYIMKCLDPHMPSFRDACLKQTTSVLHLMVQKYPMVSFHHDTQRLLLGTLDGSIVIYDMKSATRWHRIDANADRAFVSAVSFSDSGKALASFSSKDSLVKIFQTNTSFFGLLGSQFSCTKTVKLPWECAPLDKPKVENIKLQWTTPSQLFLKKDVNSLTINLDSAH
ncbi:hypothetical protein SAMD00019534_115420 [Acytostelium subglobosum LB1]|uniref:hypothetical protein n=1 Tax=Acytostelium subglobosum LB1 TaxID=1410327 RepID=UPI000644EA0E|nr:hypothetical protein SAMD00019534_115420 [Acytostelium subglobosum LB1]GAM28366.1 hypothetical protein SAMD00019534_115420 [Acytostelium subglobosum LB1]|eukprot:XP_012748683.1 hypothetical protein SAMD00019534_115420 [Acytostelium subglobosum LB1]